MEHLFAFARLEGRDRTCGVPASGADRPAPRYRFGSFLLDTRSRSLRDEAGEDIVLRRSEYAVLLALVENAGRILSRDQLRDAVSGRDADAFDRSVDVLIGRLRKKLKDHPRAPHFIMTVTGMGYRFTPKVRRICRDQERTLPKTEVLVIQPFDHSGYSGQRSLWQDLDDELRVALRDAMPAVTLIEPDQAGEMVDPHHVLRGSIRSSGSKIRIIVHLIDNASGRLLFSRGFDTANGDHLLEFTEATARHIADNVRGLIGTSQHQITFPERHYIQIFEESHGSSAGLAEAIMATRHAVVGARDGLPRAFLAFLIAMKHSQSLGTDSEIREAVNIARDAIRLNGNDPAVLRYAAHAFAYLGRDFHRSLDLSETATALRPDSADVVTGNAWAHTYACHPDKAIPLFKRALQLNASGANRNSILSGLSLAHFVAGDYATALEWSSRCITESPNWARSYRFAAMSLANMGRLDQARDMGRRMLRIAPEFRIRQQINPLQDESAAWRFTQGLEAANLPI